MKPIGVYYPFCIIDFLSRCFSWFWDKICNVLRKYFISDCLITLKPEVQELGGFDVETFLLLVLVSLENKEVESGLRLVAVTPLRTKDIEAKEEQLELFCTEIDGFCLEQMVSELLVEMHRNVNCSSSLIMHLLQWLDCLELEIHTMGVCDWIESQTNPHWKIWAFERCNLPPFDPGTILYWQVSSLERRSARILNLPGIWQILRIMSCSRHQWRISHTSMHRLGECVSPCLLIHETIVVLSVDIITQ